MRPRAIPNQPSARATCLSFTVRPFNFLRKHTFTPAGALGLTASSRLWMQLSFLCLNVSKPIRCVVERHAVRDDEARIDLALFDAREQRREVTLNVRLAALERQPAIDDRAHRKRIDDTAVDARHRDGSAVANRHDDIAQYGRPIALELDELLGSVEEAFRSPERALPSRRRPCMSRVRAPRSVPPERR